MQNVSHCEVDFRISATTLLVMEPACVPDTRQDETVADASGIISITGKPCNRADRSRGKQKAILVAKIASTEKLRQCHGNCQAGKIVIGQRRVAAMSRDQN